MPAPSAPGDGVDRDVFVVHADDDAPFVHGELLPMLNLAADRVILSSALPLPAFTEQAIERAARRSRLTIAVLSPAYLRDRWASFAELLSRNVDDDGGGGRLVPLVIAECEVPAILAQHAALDGRTQPQRALAAARLREWLGRPEPLAAPIECPYPGMRPFSAATAASPLKHYQEVTSAAFSPDGTSVVTASLNGTARIWDAGPAILSASPSSTTCRSRVPRSVPTAPPSSPPASMAPRGSGTSRPATPSARPSSTTCRSRVPRSAPTAPVSSPPATIALRGSGTPRPAPLSASPSSTTRQSRAPRSVPMAPVSSPPATIAPRGSGTPRPAPPPASPSSTTER